MTDRNANGPVRLASVDDPSSASMPMLGPVGGSALHQVLLGLATLAALGLMVMQVVATRDNAGRSVGLSFEDVGPGLEVSEVTPDGPADQGGLQVGDRLLQLGTIDLEYGLDYDRVARHFEPGQVVLFRILRESRPMTLEIFPGRPAAWLPGGATRAIDGGLSDCRRIGGEAVGRFEGPFVVLALDLGRAGSRTTVGHHRLGANGHDRAVFLPTPGGRTDGNRAAPGVGDSGSARVAAPMASSRHRVSRSGLDPRGRGDRDIRYRVFD